MKDGERKDMILSGSMYKVLFTLSIPIMVNNLIQTLYNLADGVWVSKISSVHFAATAFVWPVNFLFISIGFGLTIAGTSILSQLIGGDKYEEANDYVNQLMVISMLTALVFSLVGYMITPYVINLMGARDLVNIAIFI